MGGKVVGVRWGPRVSGCVTGLLAGLTILASSASAGTTPVELRSDGLLSIDGRAVSCKSGVRTILDAKLPNLGIATRTLLVLNPALLGRYSATVRMFVYHHECGHHHVGGDELGADCWAVKQGVSAGWLREQQLGEICNSFGNAKATATHPAALSRCRALRACYVAALKAPPVPAHPPEVAAVPAVKLVPKLVHEGFTAPTSLTPER